MGPAEEFRHSVRPYVLSNKNFNKIFVIGAHKTGTTTLEGVLKLYGYSMPVQAEQEIQTALQCLRCDYTSLQTFVSRYDAFQDMPFCFGDYYVACDALFPNSRFVLTERDPEEWFKSYVSFTQKVFAIDDISTVTEVDVARFNYLFVGYSYQYMKWFLSECEGDRGAWERLFDKDFYISQYLERNKRIKKYFQNAPQKLLVLDVTSAETTFDLCRFLDIPPKWTIGMPQLNET